MGKKQTRQDVLDAAIKLALTYSPDFKTWSNFNWALTNVYDNTPARMRVMVAWTYQRPGKDFDFTNPSKNSNPYVGWNLYEIITEEEMTYVQAKMGIKEPFLAGKSSSRGFQFGLRMRMVTQAYQETVNLLQKPKYASNLLLAGYSHSLLTIREELSKSSGEEAALALLKKVKQIQVLIQGIVK